MYPFEECGMRASDSNEIRQHVEEYHRCDISLESMGITQLPTVTKRRKQDFSELVIDEYGTIDTDDLEADDDFTPTDDEQLLQDDDEDASEETVSEEVLDTNRTTRKRKPIITVVSPPKKRKKVEANKNETDKNSTLACDICDIIFTRKYNLIRHMKNKH